MSLVIFNLKQNFILMSIWTLRLSFENTIILSFKVFCAPWLVRIFIKWRILRILKRKFALLISLWIILWFAFKGAMDFFTLKRLKTKSFFSYTITTFRIFRVIFIIRSPHLIRFSIFCCRKRLYGRKSRRILSKRLRIIFMN